jgi:hypothetical protein
VQKYISNPRANALGSFTLGIGSPIKFLPMNGALVPG